MPGGVAHLPITSAWPSSASRIPRKAIAALRTFSAGSVPRVGSGAHGYAHTGKPLRRPLLRNGVQPIQATRFPARYQGAFSFAKPRERTWRHCETGEASHEIEGIVPGHTLEGRAALLYEAFEEVQGLDPDVERF